MSQVRPGPAPRRGSDVVVLVSASHTRMCGPAAAVEHERRASAAAIEAASSSRRRPSYVMAQQPQNAVVTEETNGQDFACNADVSFEEESRMPIVRLVHHGPRAYVEMIDREAHSNRHSSSPQPPMVVSRSPSPLSRTSSPFSRPPTPIARPSSPKFRAMSPMQVARLSSYRAAAAGNVGSPLSPRFPQPALDVRYTGHKRSRSGSWPFPKSASSSRPQSGTALLKIVEDCMLCAKKSKMLDEQRAALAASPNDLQANMNTSDSVTADTGCQNTGVSKSGSCSSELREQHTRSHHPSSHIDSVTTADHVQRRARSTAFSSTIHSRHQSRTSPSPSAALRAVKRRGEVTDFVASASPASRAGSSATAAIVAAAASAAGIHLEANGNEIEPCLDCLEEFVRRRRVEKGEAGITSVERLYESKGKAVQFQRASSPLASSERKEVLNAMTVSSRLSTTETAECKRPGSRNAPAGGATDGVSLASTGHTSSSIHQSPASSSPQSPSPYRCPVCNACKCCGSIPPNYKT